MKTIYYAFLGLFIFSNHYGIAQKSLNNFIPGYYITNNNDTIKGYLKNLSDSRSCEKIRFKKDSVSKAVNIYPISTKAYKRGNEYFITKNVGNNGLNTIAYVKPIIVGELSLYHRWVMRTNSTAYGTYASEVRLTYIEIKGKPILKIKNTNDRKKVAAYLSDNKVLAYQILNKEIKDIEHIVNEYNNWVINGRVNDISSEFKSDYEEKLDLLTDSEWALEFPFALTKSFLLVEAQLAKSVQVTNGMRPDFGFGFRYSANDEFKLRFGFRYWSMPINPSYQLFIGPEDNFYEFNIIEKSALHNLSLYMYLHYEGTHAFIGGGFNFGVNYFYKTELFYYDENNNFLFSEKDNKTFLTSDFMRQNHFEILAGLKFNTKSKLAFRPFVKGSIPFQSLYDSNTPSNTAYDIYAPQISIGLITELSLTE